MDKAKLTILDRAQVTQRTSLKKESINRMARAGEFPQPIRLGERRRVGWIEAEVEQWIAEQIAASRQPLEKAA